MPEFIVTDPSGKEHIVNAPKGATQEQALAYAKAQFSQQVTKAPEASATQRTISEVMKGMTQGGPPAALVRGLFQAVPAISNFENKVINDTAYGAGGVATDLASRVGMSPEAAGGVGVLANMGIQAAPMMASGYVTGKLAAPLFGSVSGESSRVLKKATDLGAKTTPGQRTGSPTLQRLEASMESFPPTAGPMARLKAGNQKLLNMTQAKSIGENADEVGTTVLSKASDRISGEFERLTKGKNFSLTDKHFDNLAGIEKEYNDITGKALDHPLVKQATNLIAEGKLTGEAYQDLVSKLGKATYSNMTSQGGDRTLGIALGDVKSMLDDAIAPQMGKMDQAAFNKARSEWRSMLNLLKPGVVNESTGNVSGATLANVLKRKDRHGFTFGKNQSDAYTMARFSQAFKPIVGDSGTATRGFLPWLLATGGFGGAAGTYMGAPIAGAVTGLGLPLAANLGARAYLSGPLGPGVKNLLTGLLSRGATAPEY